jgi:hypothetical protein
VRSPTLGSLWLFLAIALPTLAALLAPMPAVDLAYQLRAGGEILSSRSIPSVDSWTFTVAGTPWTDQQWLAQVLLAGIFRVLGWSGLAILRAALVGLTFGLVLWLVRLRDPLLSRRAAALLVLGAFAVIAQALALRPQLFAIPLFVLVLVILAARSAHPRWIWAIPFITLAWANLHGSFPLVFLLLALALFAELLGSRRTLPTPGSAGRGALSRTPRDLGAVTLASVAASILTPFGPGVWSYVANLATNPTISSRVSEWRPPGLTDVPGILFWLSIAIVVAFLALRVRGLGRMAIPRPPALATLLAFGVLAAITGRGLAWWPPAALFVLVPLIRSFRDAAGPGPSRATPDEPSAPGTHAMSPQAPPATASRLDRRSPLNGVVMALLALAGITLLPFWRPADATGVPLGTLTYAPAGIAEELPIFTTCPGRCPFEVADRITRVWAPQTWASWLELEVPTARFAVDSRIELFPTSIWTDADTVAGGTPAALDVLARYRVFAVVTDKATDARLDAAFAASGTWARAYTDSDGSIWLFNARQVAAP